MAISKALHLVELTAVLLGSAEGRLPEAERSEDRVNKGCRWLMPHRAQGPLKY